MASEKVKEKVAESSVQGTEDSNESDMSVRLRELEIMLKHFMVSERTLGR